MMTERKNIRSRLLNSAFSIHQSYFSSCPECGTAIPGKAEGRRMKRRLFNLLAAVSLVLCVATCWLYIQSFYYRGELILASQSKLVIASDSGRLDFVAATCQSGKLTQVAPNSIGLAPTGPTRYYDHLTLEF